VADLWWLDHAIAGVQAERVSLIFVDQIDPAAITEDQLKTDGVVVHHVGHRAAVGDADVRRDDRTAQAVGDQVAILHAGTADDPGGLIGEAAHHEAVLRRRQDEGWVQVVDLDPGAVRRGQFAGAAGEGLGVSGADADGAGRFGGVLFDTQAQAVTGEHRYLRVVGGIDRIQPHAQRAGKEWDIVAQFRGGQAYLGEGFGHGVSFGGTVRLRAG